MQACLIVSCRAATLGPVPHHTAPANLPWPSATWRPMRGVSRVRSRRRTGGSQGGERGAGRAGRRAAGRALGGRRRPPRAGPSPTRSPIWPGPTGRRCSRPPTRTGSRGAAQEALASPLTFVDEAAEAGAGAAPRRAAGAVAGRAARSCCAALAAGRRRAKLPWYGPPMSVRVDGHRAADGDLGARPGRRRRAGRAPCPHRPAAARRPDRRAGPRLRLRGASTRPRPTRRSGSSCGARRHGVGRTGRQDAAQRVTGDGAGLLPAGHPAGAPRRPAVRTGRGAGRGAVAGHRPGLRGPAGAGRASGAAASERRPGGGP